MLRRGPTLLVGPGSCLRTRAPCPQVRRSLSSAAVSSPGHRVFVALGANLGDRVSKLRHALGRLDDVGSVVSTSFLYESVPMYVTSQPAFLNAVAEMTTTLSPMDLLRSLKKIEHELGRVSAQRNGPRAIDLDIVLYDAQVLDIDGGLLQVPHPRLHERRFVLQPLCDIDASVLIPSTCGTTEGICALDLLSRLQCEVSSSRHSDADLTRVLPLRTSKREMIKWRGKAKLMGIINTTPDSFSDGGQLASEADVLTRVEKFIRHGFDFVDVGGQSTRPGARLITSEEEHRRVVPHVAAIRKEFPSIAISVDTFRADIAAAALDSGADMVNDVSAGRLDSNMLGVIRSNKCAWAAMHMRGTPDSMMSQESTDYGTAGVVSVSARELSDALAQARAKGIPRWDILVDPGYGFAKNADHSLEIARNFRSWKQDVGGYPALVGLSRKSSLAGIIPRLYEEPPDSRDFATAGAVVAAVNAGADIVRVHNPAIADAITVAHEMGCIA